jgi:predicted MFS family arabinose efflux permease
LGKKDNLSEGILGWIIGIFPISGSMFTPLVPILCKKFSRINLLCFATFCEATCTICYGLLIFISNYNLLMIIIFSLRILHGCCSAIIGTLVYSLTILLADKDSTQSSLGKLEIAWAVGCSSGPLFASFFYNIGGYSLPFIASGMCLYISVYLSRQVDAKILKEDDEKEDDGNINYFRYLFYKEIFLVLIGFSICMVNVTFYFPCLTYHLINNYSVSVSVASLFFITPIIPYIIILQFLDRISAKFGIYLTFTFGLILSGISSLFIYPVPPMPHSLLFIIIGFFMIGTGSVPVFIPGLVLLSRNIKKIDKKDSSIIYYLVFDLFAFSGMGLYVQ